MPQMERLAQRLQQAMALDISAELLTAVVMTSHPKRLQELFGKSSGRLLGAHRAALQRPNSAAAARERLRAKALLDLVRARIAAIGSRKATVDKLLALMDGKPARNVVDLRKAA